MSEAEIREREADAAGEESWPRGLEVRWLEDEMGGPPALPGGRRVGGGPARLPRGPYIQTEEGLVHIATYFP